MNFAQLGGVHALVDAMAPFGDCAIALALTCVVFLLMRQSFRAAVEDFNFAFTFCDMKQLLPLQFLLQDVLLCSIGLNVLAIALEPSPSGLIFMLVSGTLGFLAAGDVMRHLRPGNARGRRTAAFVFGMLLFIFVFPMAVLIWFAIRNWQQECLRIQHHKKRKLS